MDADEDFLLWVCRKSWDFTEMNSTTSMCATDFEEPHSLLLTSPNVLFLQVAYYSAYVVGQVSNLSLAFLSPRQD